MALFFRVFIFAAFLMAAHAGSSQTRNSVALVVKNKDTKQNIGGAEVTVKGSELKGSSNEAGVVLFEGVPSGEQVFEIRSLGYEEAELKLTVPLTGTQEQVVLLEMNNEVGEVTITSTRTGRVIEAEPTRVEAIDEEEIDEKISMQPANVSMVLAESTGIQVQQTSATSNTQSVRIQGLDGRYTQILKDGFPAYGGFSGSLSVLEIPPLDLKQVEVIKGPSATLFGGAAIAGVVNFVSKDPQNAPVTTLILNQTSALGTDFSLFRSEKFDRFGYTFLGSANYQKAYDVDDDDFTELPRTVAVALHPKFLLYIDPKTTFAIGNSTSYQRREGGDVIVLDGRADAFHQYFEKNSSVRNISTFNLNHQFGNGSNLLVKQSLAFFKRELDTPGYRFAGDQFDSFTDVSYSRLFGRHAVVAGGSLVRDQFREKPGTSLVRRDETRTTVGAFVQDTIDLTEKLSLEAGFRVDHAVDYGTFALPRVSVLYRFTDHLTSRVGFGMGYKTPTMFNEESETLLFRNVLPVGNTLDAERSVGGTFDVNYRNTLGEKFSYSINQMFFYTQIYDPLVLRPAIGGFYQFINADSPVTSKGFETNARVGYGIAKLFFGYTYTNAKAGYLSADRSLTLLPRHKVNSSFVLEKEDSFKSGAEFYYGSRQTLENRSLTPSTGVFGIFGEKIFEKFSLFFNAENIFDERQGRHSAVVLGSHQNPTFAEIYTHTEGRVFNGGIKIRFR